MQAQFSIPHAMFTPYSKEDLHEKLKNNKRLGCEMLVAIWARHQDPKDSFELQKERRTGEHKFMKSLADQIQAKGWEKISERQKWQVWKFAHRYIKAGTVGEMLNSGIVPTVPAKVVARNLRGIPTRKGRTPGKGVSGKRGAVAA
jgi:hypothetical protein